MSVPSYHAIITSPIFIAVGDVEASRSETFQRVLSIGVRALTLSTGSAAATRLFVELEDTDEGDLLGVIDRCVCALRSSELGDRILVHCHAGQSRSVAVCIALLMVLGRMRVDSAASLVLGSRPGASPNPSFRAQLCLLDALLHGEKAPLAGFQGGDASAVARTLRAWWAFCASLAGAALPHGRRSLSALNLESVWGSCDSDGIATLRSHAEASLGAAQMRSDVVPAIASVDDLLLSRHELHERRFCCGRCNAALFSDANVTAVHTMACGGGAACNMISIEPPRLLLAGEEGKSVTASSFPAMTPQAASATAGHLLCGRCGAKAGGWDWAGVTCACGTALHPAFYGVLSRLIVRR